MGEKREELPDILKGIAILLVVIGHNIQYGTGQSYFETRQYFNNWAFKTIYSFHMPLLMLISGYFFSYSLKKYTVWKLTLNRIQRLLVPILCWSFVPFVISLLKDKISFRVDVWILKYLCIAGNNLWFLWAVLILSFVVILSKYIAGNSVYVYAGLLILLLFLPDSGNLYYYKFMYPYFIMGYLCNEKGVLHSNIRNPIILLGILGGAFASLLVLYNYDSYVYTTKICILTENGFKQLGIDLYRWLIGFVGSAFVILSVKLVIAERMEHPAVRIICRGLIWLGKNSLLIYIIDDLLCTYALLGITKKVTCFAPVIAAETMAIIGVCYIINMLIKRVPVFRTLLLGNR